MDVGGSGPRRRDRTALLAVAGGAAAVVLLVVLAAVVFSRADSALRDQARMRVREDTTLAAKLVAEQTLRFSEIVRVHAAALATLSARPLESLSPAQARATRRELRSLQQGTRGLRAAGLVSPTGRLLVSDPAQRAFYGRSFAFRDWFRGVTRVGSPYVSRVFRAAGAGHPKTVTVAALVRAAGTGRVIAIVTVGLQRRTEELAADIARSEGLGLTVTDQAGGVVASTGDGANGDVIAARAVVPGIGWSVAARVPTAVALKDAHDLRTLVVVLTLAIGVLLAVLTAGVVMLARRAQRLRFAQAKRVQAMHLHDGVVQALTLAIGAREAGDLAAADAAVASALAESKRITADLLPDDVQPGDLARPV